MASLGLSDNSRFCCAGVPTAALPDYDPPAYPQYTAKFSESPAPWPDVKPGQAGARLCNTRKSPLQLRWFALSLRLKSYVGPCAGRPSFPSAEGGGGPAHGSVSRGAFRRALVSPRRATLRTRLRKWAKGVLPPTLYDVAQRRAGTKKVVASRQCSARNKQLSGAVQPWSYRCMVTRGGLEKKASGGGRPRPHP